MENDPRLTQCPSIPMSIRPNVHPFQCSSDPISLLPNVHPTQCPYHTYNHCPIFICDWNIQSWPNSRDAIASKKMELVFMILTFLLAGLTRKIALQGVKVKIDIRTRSGHSLALGSLSLLKMENVTLRNHRWSCHWPCFPPCSDLEQTTHLYVVKFRLRLRALQIFQTQNKTWSTWNSSTRWRSPWGMWRSRGWFAWAEMFDTSDLSVKPFSVWTMGKSVEPSIFKFLLSGTSSVSSMSIALLASKPMNVS